MAPGPREALSRLHALAATGELAVLCRRHRLELLVAHGSAVQPRPAHGSAVQSHPVREPGDLDLAARARYGHPLDPLALATEFADLLSCEAVDLMDLRRAGPVAAARALSPHSVPLYEASPSTFAVAQIAALKIEMETRPLRLLDLELLAKR